MEVYDKFLVEMGYKHYLPDAPERFPVEVRLLGMIVVQTAIFLIMQKISSSFSIGGNGGGGGGGGLLNMFSSAMKGMNFDQQEEKPPVKDTRLDDMVDKYVGNLWTYFDGYQKSCSVPKQVTQDEFIKGFPKNIIKGWFQTWGENFAQSQDKFEKAVLSNPKVINYCKEKEGKGAVFFRSLDWHKDQYAKQVREGEKFEKEEAARVAQFEREENARVAMKKAEAFASLMIALSSFGTFMMLALLLIFSKIESNLRGVKIIEKEVSSN
jgi:hypothetical protein